MQRYKIECEGIIIDNDHFWFNVIANNTEEAEKQAYKEYCLKGLYKIISITEN